MQNKCLGCQYLNKDKKKIYSKAYLYGCNLRETGYVVYWIVTDDTLSQISCTVTDVNEEDEEDLKSLYEQMSLFD